MVSKQQGGRRNLRDLFTRESSVRSTNSIKKSSSASSSVRQLSSRTVTSTSANSGDETFPLQTITTTTTTTTTLPCSHVTPARRQYRVTFADPVCEDPGESDEEQPEPLSEQERNNYYYNTKDLENFEKDMALTALMYIKRREHGIPWEETTYSIRGVEELLRKHKTNNKSPREEHTKRVMDEQTRLERQQQQRHTSGEDDDELQQQLQQQQQQKMSDRLCLVACQSSKAERLRAMHRAREDAASAGRTASSRGSGSGSNKRFTMKKMLGVRRLGGGSSSRSLKSK